MCLELTVCAPARGVGFIISAPSCGLIVYNLFEVQVTVHREKLL